MATVGLLTLNQYGGYSGYLTDVSVQTRHVPISIELQKTTRGKPRPGTPDFLVFTGEKEIGEAWIRGRTSDGEENLSGSYIAAKLRAPMFGHTSVFGIFPKTPERSDDTRYALLWKQED